MKFFARIKTILAPATLQERLNAELQKQNDLLKSSLEIIQQHEAQVSISQAMIAVLNVELEKLTPQDRRASHPLPQGQNSLTIEEQMFFADSPVDFRTGARLFGQ